MAEFFLFIVPTGQGKFVVTRTHPPASPPDQIENWVADGPVPLIEPPGSSITHERLNDYLERLRRHGYVVKRML